MDHRNNFNLLRLFAACQVVFMHSYAHLHLPAPSWLFAALAQFPGVALFFVVSGFLVSDSCLRSSAGEFFFKRSLRIYPGLIVNIVVLEGLMFMTGGLKTESWATYLTIYSQVYLLTASDWIAGQFVSVHHIKSFFHDYPSGVLWTLTVELSFYLVLPVLMTVVKHSRPVGIALICAEAVLSFKMASGSDQSFYNEHALYALTIVPYFWVFALGIIARLFWDVLAPFLENKFPIWLAVYVSVAFLIWVTNPSLVWLEYKFSPDAITFLRMTIMTSVALSAAHSFVDLTKRLGIDRNDFSYGLYLWHMLVVSTLLGLGAINHWWLWPVVYAGGFGFAGLSWFFVERPFLQLKNTHLAAPVLKPVVPQN